MFGYVSAHKPELRMREFYKYKAYYCGLCKVLREKYGFLGSFYLVTNWASGRYGSYSALVAKGHEIGSHSDSHSSSDGELASSQNTINQNLTVMICNAQSI